MRFRREGPYNWLSNFHSVEIELDGETYPSVEHAFQAAKCLPDDRARVQIRNERAAAKVKSLGRKVLLRPDWEEVKDGVLKGLLRQKFCHPPLQAKLLETGEAIIVESNYWHDNYWGCCTCNSCPGVGENRLGELIMKIRFELTGGVSRCSVPKPRQFQSGRHWSG
jgi:ribA/ribD-fused uncharacterized protein